MKASLRQIIKEKYLNPKHNGTDPGHESSNYEIAKRWYKMKRLVKGTFADLCLIIAGIFSAGFGLKGFLLNNGFIDGGATGISLLLTELTGLPLSVLLLLVNLPFMILGLRVVGKIFAIKAILAIIGLALVVAIVPYPGITDDKLLIAVFGGFFLGTGIGLSIRGGAVIDGTEVLAIALSRRIGLSIGDVILIVNLIVFSFAAWLINIETALYAMLTYLAASKTVDFLLEGIEEYTGVTIVSARTDEIREMISHQLNYGVTVYKGERGYGKTGSKQYDIKIIYTVLTRLEISRLKREVDRIDPNAFIVMHSVKDAVGGMTKKRRHQH
jgi:uncharacterized membrane-anchored protein YitT (DUF2179 family)